LTSILAALSDIGRTAVFPIHPRTKQRLIEFGLENTLGDNVIAIDPVGYLDMISLEQNARGILTDSGGVQKEAYWLRVPCITLRDETEWVETVMSGWNTLTGTNSENIVRRATDISDGADMDFEQERAASRICDVLKRGGSAS
jgi:UDP-GlcNAc3NAcA epimerase